jgi:NTP pyrophosphatase (non-canonical NTP hydrolase)
MDDLVKAVRAFRDEREWKPFHNPKDLAISISLEAAELLEHFQWKSAGEVEAWLSVEENRRRLGEEMADVLLLLISLADVVGLDLLTVTHAKPRETPTRYSAGRAERSGTECDELAW